MSVGVPVGSFSPEVLPYHTMSSPPARQSVVNLFRGLLRTARCLEDYNYRSYAQRRVKLGFVQNKSLSGEALNKEYQEGLQQLALLKRQATLSHLYPSKKSVMETGQ